MKKGTRFLSVVLSACLLCTVSLTTARAADAASDWAQEEVAQAISLGFVPEELQGDYQSNITRGEFAKLAVYFTAFHLNYSIEELMQACQERDPSLEEGWETTVFSDTTDEIMAYAALISVINGKGDGTSFDPDGGITRQEAACMLVRTRSACGGGYEQIVVSQEFADWNNVAQWASTDVDRIAYWEVMEGVGDNMFDPLGSYTREQAIVTFLRLEERVNWENARYYILNRPTQAEMVEGILSGQYYGDMACTFTLEERLDTQYGVLLYGYGSVGAMHGDWVSIYMVLPDGTYLDLYQDVPGDGVYSKPDPENLYLSEDGTKLYFTVSYPDGVLLEFITISRREDPMDYHYEVDLTTGTVTLLEKIPYTAAE